MDMFKKDFMMFSHVKFPDFNKLLILKETKNAWLQVQLKNHFQNLEVYKFNF